MRALSLSLSLSFSLSLSLSLSPASPLVLLYFRYGFNSHGQSVVKTRLADWPSQKSKFPGKQLGVSLGKNKKSPRTVDDYVKGIRLLGEFADYLVVNVSSPNTPGLRDMQAREKLSCLLDAVSCVYIPSLRLS